jgi:hypothetical protein
VEIGKCEWLFIVKSLISSLIDLNGSAKFTHYYLGCVEYNRMKDLLTLIKSSPFKEVKSIIIYCKFQVCMYISMFQIYHGLWYLIFSTHGFLVL